MTASASATRSTIFAAGLVLPVSTPLIRDGAFLVENGRIAAVGPLSEIGHDNPGVEVRYFPHYTMIPGAVNAHAHLGFRRGDEPEGGSFSRWMTELISRLPEKAAWTPEAARNSAREAIEAGTTFMAESSLYGECLPQLAESGLAGRVYAEFLPFELGTPEEAVDFIEKKVRSLREGLPSRVGVEVSVHAPYTVDPKSARLAAQRVRERGGRVATHLSESPEEYEFVSKGTGFLANIFERFAQENWEGKGASPVRYAEGLELLWPGAIAAHLATGVSEEDVEILARTGVAAAHCPRSNEYLGCGVSPVPEMLGRGVRVGMGTDGLWSSPSMNLFEETLFAAKLHGFDGETGLKLATLFGARALGIEGDTGSLEEGRWADFAVIKAMPAESSENPEMEVLEAAAGGGVVATVVSGEPIYNQVEDGTG
ncbi:MAG: amidohydrolase family protein [Actinobacteria bacterium]|nr:amidohydrolase family protein [Actinomycetota bacterium]